MIHPLGNMIVDLRPAYRAPYPFLACPRPLAGIIMFVLALVLAASPAWSRTIIIIGGLTIGGDINERRYHDEDQDKTEKKSTNASIRNREEGDAQRIFISPRITIQSVGVRDDLKLSYAPTAKYDAITDASNIDHLVLLQGKRLLTRDWSLSLSERFVSADNLSRTTSNGQESQPAAEATSIAATELPRDQLTTDIIHQRYYTNDASLHSDYTFTRDSTVGGGYGLNILRNDTADGTYSEFNRHELTTGLGWRASQSWKLAWDGWYVIGDFLPREQSAETEGAVVSGPTEEDLREYRSKARLTYFLNGHTSFPLSYDFKHTDYLGERSDTGIHELLLGWEHGGKNDLRLLFGAGPSYIKVADQLSSWDYAGYAGLGKKWPHGHLACRLEKKFDTDNFNGTDNNGLVDIYQGLVQYTHQLSEALEGKLSLVLRDERRLDPQGQYDQTDTTVDSETAAKDEYRKRRYQAGMGLTFRFWQHYALSSDYTFARQEADLADDAYDEHLVQVSLSMEKEWWRW